MFLYCLSSKCMILKANSRELAFSILSVDNLIW
ncbi:hypothetical protein [Escherichia phage FL20]